MKKTSTIEAVRPAGDDHQVVTVLTKGEGAYRHRRKPCADCPWRVDAVGVFPAEAFKHSAPTAYDMSQRTFSCHSSGIDKPATCAGFLLRGADHNLQIRLAYFSGRIDGSTISDGGVALFDSYREMAVANGVDPDDPVLQPCR